VSRGQRNGSPWPYSKLQIKWDYKTHTESVQRHSPWSWKFDCVALSAARCANVPSAAPTFTFYSPHVSLLSEAVRVQIDASALTAL
jgi:hypothetical protein